MQLITRNLVLRFFGTLVFTFALFAPARVYQGMLQHHYTPLKWLWVTGGDDFIRILPLVLLYGFIVDLIRSEKIRNTVTKLSLIFLFCLVFLSILFIECWGQMGIFPSLAELLSGFDDLPFLLTVMLNWKTAVTVVGLIIGVYFLAKLIDHAMNPVQMRQWVIFYGILSTIYLGGFWAIRNPSAEDLTIRAQAGYFTDQVWHKPAAELFWDLDLGQEHLAEGASLLGLRFVGNSTLCKLHPFKEDLSAILTNANASEWVKLGQEGAAQANVDGAIYWHIFLESTRLTDFTEPVNQELAPFQTQIFLNAKKYSNWSVVRPKRAYQAGVRTTQSFSAQLCGLGTMPMGVSFARELGFLPFRCLPDVLHDADVGMSYGYAGSLYFDKMFQFLEMHKVTDFYFKPDLTDAILLKDVLNELKNKPPTKKFQYKWVMTISHHYPYTVPKDMPADLYANAQAIVQRYGIKKTEQAQWILLAYQDWVLRDFVTRLQEMGLAKKSIILFTGDHSTNDPFLSLKNGDAPSPSQQTEIPLVIFNPFKTSNARLSAIEKQVISHNDIPRLELSLLSGMGALKKLPPNKAWATIGGQSLSSNYKRPKLLGISAISELYEVDQNLDPKSLHEKPQLSADRAEFASTHPTLLPEAELMSWFMKTYGKFCKEF